MSGAESNTDRPFSTSECWFGASVVVTAILAMVWPMFGPLEEDSFPLSTFPMFAHHRGQPRMHQLVALSTNGQERRLSPEHIGTSEVLQAKSVIDRAARNPKRAAALCRKVAERVSNDDDYTDVERLEIRRVRFDPIKYFSENPEPIESKRVARCRIAQAGGDRP